MTLSLKGVHVHNPTAIRESERHSEGNAIEERLDLNTCPKRRLCHPSKHPTQRNPKMAYLLIGDAADAGRHTTAGTPRRHTATARGQGARGVPSGLDDTPGPGSESGC